MHTYDASCITTTPFSVSVIGPHPILFKEPRTPAAHIFHACLLTMEPNATSTPPKISLYSFPRQRPDPPGLATPPLRLPVSIPFLWEEEPGKPKKESEIRGPSSSLRSSQSPLRSRALDLPPRMVGKTDDVDSPTTVLGGPYVLSRTGSLSGCYSFTHAEEEPSADAGVRGRKKEKALWFWRRRRRRKVRRDGNWEASDLDSSAASSHSWNKTGGGGRDGVGDGEKSEQADQEEEEEEEGRKVRLTRFRSSRSLGSVSHYGTSHLWARLYESMKQVVPWRRERKTQDS